MIHPLFISQNKTISGSDPANGYIEFEINSSSGAFTIPFSQQIQHGASWSFAIYVNGEFKANSVGTVSNISGTGYALTGLSGATSIIRITPQSGMLPVLGWGAAFGFYGNASGCNAQSNKAKLLRIINDPDYAHCLPGTSGMSGAYFRQHQYYGCVNLTNAAPEGLPDIITSIGGNFRIGQYQGCTSLTIPADEKLNNKITAIGNNFRANQYYSTGLIQATREDMPESITSFGQAIRQRQYYNCHNLLIGNHTHSYQFSALLNAYTTNYQYMFSSVNIISTPDAMPKYYTDSSESASLPVTDLIPTASKQYVTNRIGIIGYDSLNANWK